MIIETRVLIMTIQTRLIIKNQLWRQLSLEYIYLFPQKKEQSLNTEEIYRRNIQKKHISWERLGLKGWGLKGDLNI